MPHTFEIVTDSTCDLTPAQLEELGVEMVPLHVYVGDECFLDQVELTPEQFYDKMAASSELPHSSQPSPSGFGSAYAKLAEAGAPQLLSIHIAQALSGTANSAALAAKDAPVPVRVWDSKTATAGCATFVREAAAMRDAGETLEACVAHLDELRRQSYLVFMLDTLENIVKNGRCSRAKGLMSSLLNINAVLDVEDDGSLLPVGKGRGQQRALESLAGLVEARYGAGAALTAVPITVRASNGCAEMIQILRAHGFELDVRPTVSVGPVIATHTGPGLVGVTLVPTAALYRA